MYGRICFFILLFCMTGSAYAEYYLVESAPEPQPVYIVPSSSSACYTCGCQYGPPCYYPPTYISIHSTAPHRYPHRSYSSGQTNEYAWIGDP